MSDSNRTYNQVGKSSVKHLRRSKTITVSDFTNGDGKKNNEVSFIEVGEEKRSPSPPLQPTSSCQALRHAVSALTRIDDFILQELGDGFFANVYKATHRVTGEEMVMKINKDSANRASSLREVQLMNKLSHPNILRFLGVCVHEGQLHALTEYIGGGTLETLLKDYDEELPWTLRIKLSLDIGKGMRYLHMEGVFHRDLTSKNVLIKKQEGKQYMAIVADFGLATKIPDPAALEPLPPVGCPWWMAPEVINGKFYDERADFFSFGIMCLEITARIEADPDTMPRTQKFGVDYVRFCEMVDYCPLDYLQLAFKCCQILPEKRPTSNVIISTLEQLYKTLKISPIMNSVGRLHKRSRSEDNIIQSSDSYIGTEEVFMTPQIIAQAMSKDDPLYLPADVNPFLNISKYKDGRKILEWPRSRKFSGNSSGLGSSYGSSGRSGEQLLSSGNLGQHGKNFEIQGSQSLPCSPEMLRRAAEKLHQASLHGKDAVKTDSRHNIVLSFSNFSQPSSDTTVVQASDRRAAFGSSRTRSLGALDFFNPTVGPQRLIGDMSGKGYGQSKSERAGYCNYPTNDIRESSIENMLDTESYDSSEMLNDISYQSELDSETNPSMTSNACETFYSCYEGDDTESGNVAPLGSDESQSTGSLSSFASAGDQPEDSNWSPSSERYIQQPPTVEVTDERSKPLIAEEIGSFNSDHFGKVSKNGKVKTSTLKDKKQKK